jgi:hypothetical protein
MFEQVIDTSRNISKAATLKASGRIALEVMSARSKGLTYVLAHKVWALSSYVQHL